MIKSYFKLAWRNFIRNKSYSFINIIGLTTALSAFIIIVLFVYDELSFDRYHEDADRLFRIERVFDLDDQTSKSLLTSNLLAPALESEITGIQETTRIRREFAGSLITTEKLKQYEEGVLIADPSIFNLFSISFLQGNSETALNRAFTVVVTESTAKRYFGNENPIGQNLKIKTRYGEEEEYEVTGVIKDIPANTHFSFDLLTSIESYRSVIPDPEEDFESWYHVGAYTYLKLGETITDDSIEAQLPEFLKRHQGESAQHEKLRLQPVIDIHLHSNHKYELQANSDVRYIYIFGSLAILILFVASVNYANLSTASVADHAKEIGVQKTLGMSNFQLFNRQLMESVILSSFSVLLAVTLSEVLLPLFNNLIDKELSLFTAPTILSLFLLFFVGAFGILNTIYPSIAFSKITPSRILRGATSQKKKATLRNSLIVFQFTISVILIVSTLTIHNQLEYVNNKRLGLNDEQVITVHADAGLNSNFSTFKDRLKSHQSIKNVTFTGEPLPFTSVLAIGLYPSGSEPSSNNAIGIGPEFLATMEIPLVKGQILDSLSFSFENDFFPVLINEAAMKEFGWEDNPIGQTFNGFKPTATVTGVVGDFHYESLKNRIEPVVLMGNFAPPRTIYIRIQSNNLASTLTTIEKVWNEIGPGTPFVYSFLDNDFEKLYKAEEKMVSVFSYFTILAIIIACLGLFGLSAFTAERRTKEIGIRKVLGASLLDIVALLSKDFIKLVIIGFLLAIPISWYAMNQWLTDFAYRIEIGTEFFVTAGLAAILIAILTVSWQSIRAALANPVDSLRSE